MLSTIIRIIIIMEFVGGGSFYFGLFVCLSVCLSVCMPVVCLFVCLFFHLSHQFHWNMKTRKARVTTWVATVYVEADKWHHENKLAPVAIPGTMYR